ncbi:KH domain-containing protein [Patescibacteria group bacterium]|nr:KH domain-containing protein [Patescibacteria group bacterium]
MQDLIEFILKQITNHPDEIEVSVEKETDINQVRFNVLLNPEDMGIVIGKDGRTIKSIRNLVNIIALPKGINIYLDVKEKGKIAAL